jgi:NAD(P)-dependent dehydrogenase (short-subunit alcohol dehydrogenase family)
MTSQIYPLKRTGKIEEVVNAILFIASDKASFSTGMLFPVDGGAAAGNV